MAINRQMFESAMSVARANPGTSVDLRHSNTYELLLRNEKKQKFWHIAHNGKIRKLRKVPT